MSDIETQVLKHLEEKHYSYVLVVCDHSSRKDIMNVKMSYSGDPKLASYLIAGASERLDCEIESETDG